MNILEILDAGVGVRCYLLDLAQHAIFVLVSGSPPSNETQKPCVA